MDVVSVGTKPIEGQKPGTSGLRKKVPVFQAPHYVAELRAGHLRQPRGICRADPGRRRGRPLLQPRGHPGHPPHGGGQRLRPDPGRPGRPALHTRRVLRHPRDAGPSAASSCPPPTTQAARTATSASNTTPATAVPRPRRSPRRSIDRTQTLARIQHAGRARHRPRGARQPSRLGEAIVEVIDPVADYAALMRSLFDFDRHPRGHPGRPDAAVRRDARGHRPLCQGHHRGRTGRAGRQRRQRHAPARFRRPPPRPQPRPFPRRCSI